MDEPKKLIPVDNINTKKSKKIPFNLRVDEDLVKETKLRVEELKINDDKMSTTQYVINALKQVNEGRDYNSVVMKNHVLVSENTELKKENKELKSLTTKKIPTVKRVSIGFTRIEYDLIDATAHKMKISRNQFIKNLIFPQQNCLPDNIKAIADNVTHH